jgi:gliding motility-associated-like protein
MRLKNLQLSLFFLVISVVAVGQLNIPGTYEIESDSISELSQSVWEVISEESKEYSTRLRSDRGEIATIIGSRPINYKVEGEWKSIDHRLSEYNNGWAAMGQPHPLMIENSGEVFFDWGNQSQIKIESQIKQNLQQKKLVFKDFSKTKNAVNWTIGEHIEKVVYAFENAIKYHYSINGHISDDIVIIEKIEINEEFILKNENGELTFFSETKGQLVKFSVPVIFDQNGEYILGKYKPVIKGDEIFLELQVDKEWMSSTERAYPIIIDPTVTGPTSNWTGGNMPSCIIPSYNRDSILVTIPGGTMVTGLYVTGSFYADPFTTATMGQGEMRYSTSCGTSQGFVVTGANSNLPGTAYLDSVSIMNPLTCCFPENCSDTSFWLTMMLGRTGPGTGCNTSFIRYDALTTLWPFKAVIVGKTVESYGSQWNVIQTSVCSNTCELTALAYAMNGVPPYTFSHPWSNEIVTQGQSIGCGNGANNHQFTLTIPDCPIYCDSNFTSLVVPPAVITDACGNSVSGMQNETITIKPAPHVSFNGNTNLCSGEETSILLDACLTGALAYWEGNGTNGVGGIYQVMNNQSGTTDSTQFIAYSSLNNCQSDTTLITVYNSLVQPALYSWNPNPAIVSETVQFSSGSGGDIISWEWTIDGTAVSGQPQFEIIENNPGEYEVCLIVTSYPNCPDTLCKMVTIAPATVLAPNIITSNGDGINDLVVFRYLEFYPNNRVSILNRWGNTVFEKEGYQNDWNPRDLTEGVYFYHVFINDGEQELQGFFHLEKE